ncbi:hypothetical protein CW731_03885 [Polaribacter sp. ALD11]|uniref:hypothetical protein n=1 Tax=Polaribacter sp. ALD11 TaxID=2058137 RepID=UPI000C3112A8|nr:hypothetical protein [Polaribacter sp. ALD11]AUC84489.1 hypothetical protein CW731_03885 [Polaribacter sp. ALD11]
MIRHKTDTIMEAANLDKECGTRNKLTVITASACPNNSETIKNVDCFIVKTNLIEEWRFIKINGVVMTKLERLLI